MNRHRYRPPWTRTTPKASPWDFRTPHQIGPKHELDRRGWGIVDKPPAIASAVAVLWDVWQWVKYVPGTGVEHPGTLERLQTDIAAVAGLDERCLTLSAYEAARLATAVEGSAVPVSGALERSGGNSVASLPETPKGPLAGLELAGVACSVNVVKAVLASGFPVVAGFGITDSFNDPSVYASGQLRLPQYGEEVNDGTAVLITGWDDKADTLLFRGHWGVEWGDDGFGHIPYKYFSNLAWLYESFMLMPCINA